MTLLVLAPLPGAVSLNACTWIRDCFGTCTVDKFMTEKPLRIICSRNEKRFIGLSRLDTSHSELALTTNRNKDANAPVCDGNAS